MSVRIPETIVKFNRYIRSTDNYQQAGTPIINAIRLSLSSAQSDNWHSKRMEWDALYAKYIDKNQCTRTVRKNVAKFIKSFRKFGNPLLKIMAASTAAKQDDANAFNFVLVRKKPSRPTEQIEEKCFATCESLGGGDVKIRCRTATGTGRARLAAGANSVQYACKTGNLEPSSETDGTTMALSTKATFIIRTGTGSDMRKLYLYVRWYNIRHPKLAGPWSVQVVALIT